MYINVERYANIVHAVIPNQCWILIKLIYHTGCHNYIFSFAQHQSGFSHPFFEVVPTRFSCQRRFSIKCKLPSSCCFMLTDASKGTVADATRTPFLAACVIGTICPFLGVVKKVEMTVEVGRGGVHIWARPGRHTWRRQTHSIAPNERCGTQAGRTTLKGGMNVACEYDNQLHQQSLSMKSPCDYKVEKKTISAQVKYQSIWGGNIGSCCERRSCFNAAAASASRYKLANVSE